jgi:hypothetical protein
MTFEEMNELKKYNNINFKKIKLISNEERDMREHPKGRQDKEHKRKYKKVNNNEDQYHNQHKKNNR